MPVIDLTEEQIITLLTQLTEAQRQRIFERVAEKEKPRPRFGSAANDILFIAPDFDEPLEDFQDYQ